MRCGEQSRGGHRRGEQRRGKTGGQWGGEEVPEGGNGDGIGDNQGRVLLGDDGDVAVGDADLGAEVQ